MGRANTKRWGKALLIECLEGRQMLAAQPLAGSSAAEFAYANVAKASASAKPVVNPAAPTVTTTLLDTVGYTVGYSGMPGESDGSTSASSSKSNAQPTVDYSASAIETSAASVWQSSWQSSTNAATASSLSLEGLTSPDAAPDPIRFLSLGSGTPASDHSTSPFAQATVLEWQPGELVGDPSPGEGAESVNSWPPDSVGVSQLQATNSPQHPQQESPTIFGEQWGAGSASSGRWVLRDGRFKDRPAAQTTSSRESGARKAGQNNAAPIAARRAAPAWINPRAFDALVYFAQVGGAIGTAVHANTALTAQRIGQILLACRRATADVIQISASTRFSASTRAAVLLVATALASRAARRRGEREGRAALSDQELLAVSGIAMSSTWHCFGLASHRSRPGSGE